MGLFKKLGRGIKKIVRKNQGGLGRLVKKVGPGLVVGAVTGGVGAGLIAKAASAAKTLGKKVGKGIETPKSLVPVVRAAELHVSKKARTKMPGGAPMPTIAPVKVRSITSSTPQAKRYLYRSANPKTKRGQAKMRSGDVTAGEAFTRKPKKAKRKMGPPSAKQLAARAKFAKMVAARRKKAA